MPYRFYIWIAAALLGALLCLAVFHAWRADQRDRAQLAAELAATKQLLAAADARQHDRDAQLAQTLTALAAEKRAIVTPAQIVRELPKNIPLPAPIVLQSNPQTEPTGEQASAQPQFPTGKSAGGDQQSGQRQAVLPMEDLKPFYDFTLDCKACQAKLAAIQSDLTDERTKTAALAKERDQALRIARGGSAWRRIGRAAKWFLLGAAAGALAAKAAH